VRDYEGRRKRFNLKNYLRRSLRAQMACLLALFLAAGLIQTACSIYGLEKIKNTNEFVCLDLLTSVKLLSDLKKDWSSIRLDEAHLLIDANLNRKQMRIAEHKRNFESGFQAYAALIEPEHVEEARLFEEIWGKYKDYLLMEQRVLNHSNLSEAKEEFYGSMADIFREGMDSFAQLSDVNIAEAAEARKHSQTVYDQNIYSQIIASLIVLIVVLSSIVWLYASVIRPLVELKAFIAAYARGENQGSTPYIQRFDEVGAIAKVLELLRDVDQKRARLTEKISSESLAQAEHHLALENAIQHFEISVQEAAAGLSDAEQILQSNAVVISSLVAQNGKLTDAAAQAAKKASMDVDAVATAVADLSRDITQINQSAFEASQASEHADALLVALNQKSESLEDATKTIDSVVKVIAEVAAQTNLLALNATIEASRAGEAGRGFGVVAHEVKNLAQKSSFAVAQIREQISNVQNETIYVSDAISSLTAIFVEIRHLAALIANAVNRQSDVTSEIADRARSASIVSAGISSNIESLALSTDKTEEIGHRIEAASSELNELAERTLSEIDNFLKAARAN